MILFTVGYQMPFDRMLSIIDDWSGDHPDVEVFGQIGPSSMVPKNMEYVDFLTPPAYAKLLKRADLIVAHAGTGTIVTALVEEKPIIIFPRHGDLGETRNDHQITYCERLRVIQGVRVTTTEVELRNALDAHCDMTGADAIARSASSDLIARLRAFAFSD